MRVSTRAFLIAATAVVAATPATAQVVVSGGAPNEGIGWNIFDDNRAAAQFSIGASTAFDAIRFWGLLPSGPTYSPNIFWEILTDAGGAPGSAVAASGNAAASGTQRTELAAFPGFFSWQFDLSVGSQLLSGGIYWLALHDGPLDPSGFTSSTLIWETTGTGSSAIQTFSVSDHWDVDPTQGLAFELRNNEHVVATPEPATMTLLATGLAAMGGLRLRGRRRQS